METMDLEEIARQRKERLLALKNKRNEAKQNEKNSNEPQPLPRPTFRSYIPHDESLKENCLPRARPGNVEEKIKDQLEAGTPNPVIEEVDLINLAPRKPDWDLKRDVSKKLEKLEKRTQKAIAELIRERLKQDQTNLVMAIDAAAKASENAMDSDED